MLHETTLQNLLLRLLVFASVTAIGLVLIYGARRKWRWLVDPPEWLFLLWSQSALKVLFGRRFLLGSTYFLGTVFTIGGLIGLWQVLILLSKWSLGAAIPDLGGPQQITPHVLSPGQLKLENLLKNIAGYGNVMGISILILIGIHKKWFLLGNPPQWMKRGFENTRIVRFIYVVLVLMILVSSVMVYPYLEELGRGLGYWK